MMIGKKLKGPSAWFDVDDTLVVWQSSHPEAVDLTIGKYTERVVVHRGHIESMRQHKFRGHSIVVWSAGGEDWAEDVCKALGIDDLVDLYSGKPDWYYDDIPASEYMPESIRVYKETYKGRNVGHGPQSIKDSKEPTVFALAENDIQKGDAVVVMDGKAYKV